MFLFALFFVDVILRKLSKLFEEAAGEVGGTVETYLVTDLIDAVLSGGEQGGRFLEADDLNDFSRRHS